MIKTICYNLYKEDWINTHISIEEKLQVIRDYYVESIKEGFSYSFEEYLNEFGYDGILYVSFKEFCKNEYLIKDYMKELLKDNFLIDLYLKDINK